jgi:acetyl esterase/lipase
MNPLVKTAAPILIAQGTADTTVFPTYTDQLKDQLVNAGDQVTYNKYPGVNHVGVVTTGEPDAMAFFQQQLPARP